MSATMRPIPFRDLVLASLAECRQKGSILDIPAAHFVAAGYLPIGPAAGPHTQLCQNIFAAWLAGSRAIELKTVQRLESLEVAKPCIDAADEGYNVEWSTELSLEQAYDEYLKAWFTLHLFDALLGQAGGRPGDEPASASNAAPAASSFVFTMSVGYDLEGIRTGKVDRFIDRLIDSSEEELFERYRSETEALAREAGLLAGTPWQERALRLASLADRIPPRICSSVTLSTMHGCPPDEIEAISRHLLDRKGLDTLVKLNPTLLGYERVRSLLDRLGYGYIELDRKGFVKDLAWRDALPLLERLLAFAAGRGRRFGVKLSNTLACRTAGGALAGDERYLSGRALYPLTITLAAELAEVFGDRLPMSFSGGASAWNLADILGCGIRPVTLATDLLKPGGYSRMKQLAEIAAAWAEAPALVDAARLRHAAASALDAPYFRKSFRGSDRVRVSGPLPLFDCFVAPCVAACPVGQDVPEYVHLVGAGRLEEALALIQDRNPLPFVTGWLCDHQCTAACTRRDWEGAVRIREMKLIAAEGGYAALRASGSLLARRARSRGVKAAIVGAGPAGLAAAAFLAREGFEVHVFEREREPGGVVRWTVPAFRIPAEAIEKDIALLGDLGVQMHLGARETRTVSLLRGHGFRYVLVAVGAEVDRGIGLAGALGALGFLRSFRSDPAGPALGRSVVVVGAGDTAMDAARAARRCRGVESVRVVYRRGEAEMPASEEEYEAARADGVTFSFHRDPERWRRGRLVCRVMEPGAPDGSGRPAPVRTHRRQTFRADALISAVGTAVDRSALGGLGIEDAAIDPATQETATRGVFLLGDAAGGPASIIRAIATARRASQAICAREGGSRFGPVAVPRESLEGLRLPRDRMVPASPKDADPAVVRQTESARCLGCRSACLKCVEVCPNRANTFVTVANGFRDEVQVVHLDGPCNECGACATFCPWDGKPYRDKLTVYATLEDFRSGTNVGFYWDREAALVHVRTADHSGEHRLDAERNLPVEAADERFRAVTQAIIRCHPWLAGRSS